LPPTRIIITPTAPTMTVENAVMADVPVIVRRDVPEERCDAFRRRPLLLALLRPCTP
jgi:hypothetical protein